MEKGPKSNRPELTLIQGGAEDADEFLPLRTTRDRKELQESQNRHPTSYRKASQRIIGTALDYPLLTVVPDVPDDLENWEIQKDDTPPLA